VPSLDLRFADNKSLVNATTGAQLVTFTRASSGTFVNSAGVLQTAVTNLLLRSEEFDNASWIKSGSSVTQNAAIAPNGTLTADKLVEDSSASTVHYLTVTSTVAATTCTQSIHAKAGERSWIALQGFNGATNPTAYFDVATGVVGSTSNGASAAISALADGWYRCSITYTVNSGTTTTAAVYLATTNNSAVYTGNGTSGLFLWGAQLEQASTVGEYIPTVAAINSAPRFDHNPTTGESLGLLVEEARTNLVRNNTMVGAVAGSPGTPPTNGWVIVNNATYTSSILGTGIENGINYIDIQYVVAPGAAAAVIFYCDTPAASALTAYTGSYYLKLVSGTSPQVRFVWQDGTNTYNRAFFNLTATLTRYTDTLTTAALANLTRLAVGIDAAPSGTTFVIRVGLPQTEQGAFATSVIPTTSATVTRAADVASITGSNFSSFYNQTEGTVFAETQLQSTSARNAAGFDINDNSTNNRSIFRAFTTGSFDQYLVRSGSSTVVTIASTTAPTLVTRKSISAYKINDFAITADGLAPNLDTSGAVPVAVTQMFIGSAQAGAEFMGGTIKRLTYWPVRFADNTLQQITQP
jgi:hypothetical protein